MTNTNWYVITGGPSSGKTTVLRKLEKMGYAIYPEAARVLIDKEIAEGKTLKEIRRDEAEFQKKVLKIKIETEKKTPKDKIVFFDRAVPDSIAYYQIAGLDPVSVIEESKKRKYRGIFFLERLMLEKDYARIEDEKTAGDLNRLLYHAYLNLGYNVIRVPLKPIEERVKFILSKLDFVINTRF